MDKIPVTDTIIYSLSRMIDDSQHERRDPSHSDLEFLITKFNLDSADPNKINRNSPVGKAKRLRAVLNWAIENDLENCEKICFSLLNQIKSCGGFRSSSPNYVGINAIEDIKNALKEENIELSLDGTITNIILENLHGANLTKALENYAYRAKRGIQDAALLVGTGKDLMEAVAAHILVELWGNYPKQSNFPLLLGQAFTALGLATDANSIEEGEHPRNKLERDMYSLACSINKLRNKQGVGHGRPWIPDLSEREALAAIEFIGIISERLLKELKTK